MSRIFRLTQQKDENVPSRSLYIVSKDSKIKEIQQRSCTTSYMTTKSFHFVLVEFYFMPNVIYVSQSSCTCFRHFDYIQDIRQILFIIFGPQNLACPTLERNTVLDVYLRSPTKRVYHEMGKITIISAPMYVIFMALLGSDMQCISYTLKFIEFLKKQLLLLISHICVKKFLVVLSHCYFRCQQYSLR